MRPRLLSLTPFALATMFIASCSGLAPQHDAVGAPEAALEMPASDLEGVARGFPELRGIDGQRLADGEFTQWLDGDRLHVKIRYDFGAERSIEEQSVLRQEPTLVQERWSWVEMRDGELQRKFEVDFLSGTATAEKRDEHELHRWSERVDVQPGRAFAGASWALAIKSLRERLLRGEKVRLQTVGFTPQPRAATVEISYVGTDHLPMSGRTLTGDRFVIHPRIPPIAKLFVHVPDSRIWLANPPPAAFLRFEGPLAEPDDAIVRVELLPGDPSGDALPVRP